MVPLCTQRDHQQRTVFNWVQVSPGRLDQQRSERLLAALMCGWSYQPSMQHVTCTLNFFIQFSFRLCDHKISGHFCGLSRSAHNTVLNHSPIYLQQKYPLPGFCILGDWGYPCLKQWPPHGQPLQNQLQVWFNGHLSRATCVVERAFGTPKTRWRSIFGFWAFQVLCRKDNTIQKNRSR